MARKSGQEPEREATEYYKLKTEAVENLVTADSTNSPKVPEEELRKYRRNSNIQVPNTVKVLFVKFWFAGAVCYFVIWGLGLYLGSVLDLLVVAAVVMGFVTDLLANNVLRFMEETPGVNEKWIMVRKRRYVSLILNLLYAGVLMTLVYLFYEYLNIAITTRTGDTQSVPVGVEPLLFGLLYMGFDLALVGLRNLVKKIIAGAKGVR
jgi:hypothetical protein